MKLLYYVLNGSRIVPRETIPTNQGAEYAFEPHGDHLLPGAVTARSKSTCFTSLLSAVTAKFNTARITPYCALTAQHKGR